MHATLTCPAQSGGRFYTKSWVRGYRFEFVEEASVAVIGANGQSSIDTSNGNFGIGKDAESSVFKADAIVNQGVLTGKDNKKGLHLGAGAGASVLAASTTFNVTLFGVKFGVTTGGTVCSAEAEVGGYYDSQKGIVTHKGKVKAAWGAGVRLGVDITYKQI